MKWSVSLGSIAGIRFQVHLTFLLLLLFVAFVGYGEAGWGGALAGVLFILTLFVCVILHELSHSMVAIRFGSHVDSITLLPIGGVAGMRSIPESPLQEILVTLAGPLASVGIFAILAAILRPVVSELGTLDPFATDPRTFFLTLMMVNLGLAGFNLIPAFPMDGGRVLRGLLALALPYVTATRIAVVVGQVIAVGFIVYAFLSGSLWLGLIGFFIFTGAGSEAHRMKLRVAFSMVPVTDAMTTAFRTLDPDDPVGLAFADLVHGFQDHFPVTREGRLMGMLSRPTIVALLRRGQADLRAREIMTTDLPALSPEQNLQHAWDAMTETRSPVLPVISQGYLVGMITHEGINRYFLMQRRSRR